MRLLEELCETGVYTEYTPKKTMTVRDWLQKLNLNQIFTVLVNGKKVDVDQKIGPRDKVVIIPQIAGGQQETPMDKLKWLLESFDKKYIEELFEEGEKVNLFNLGERENFQYPFNGWIYTLSRYKQPDPYQELLKKMGI